MSRPFNITISIPSGNPEKLRLIEKTNRLSLGLIFNRDELAEVARHRKELEFTGIYMLVNTSSDALPEIYVGEGESIISRLKSHSKDPKKDFWEWVVVFVNRDNSLHKGHIQHVEASLVERAKANKRCIIKNDKNPSKPTLAETVLYEAEDFLSDIYQIVPLLGISAFELVPDNTKSDKAEPLYIHTKGIAAEAYTLDGKVVVRKGSQSIKENVPSISNSFSSLRAALVEQGVLIDQGESYTFEQDYTFDSPSTAAATVMGRNANGRTEWKTEGGITLKELQEQSLK